MGNNNNLLKFLYRYAFFRKTLPYFSPYKKTYSYIIYSFLDRGFFPIIDSLKFYLFSLFKKKYNVNKPISILTFSFTNSCNAKCVFCNYRNLSDKKNIMDFFIFTKGIDQFIDMGGKDVIFSPTVGENTLDPGLFEKLDYAHKKKLKTIVYTNGILLNQKDMYKKIVESGIYSLNISIGDINPIYEYKIFGISLDFAKNKLGGLKKLLEYNNDIQKINKIVLHFRNSRLPKDIINDKLFSYIKNTKWNFDLNYYFTRGYDNWGGTIKQKELLGIMKLRIPLFFKKETCFAMFDKVSILGNGDVRLCGCRIKSTEFDELIVGNINNDTLENILSSDKVKKLRESFTKKTMPDVCKKCSFYYPVSDYK